MAKECLSTRQRMQLIEMEFERSKMWALHWNARIVSGDYKRRKMQAPRDGGGWRDFTDEEKLADSLEVMERHLASMSDLTVKWAELAAEVDDAE